MRKNELQKVKTKSVTELIALVSEKKKQVVRMKLEHGIGKLKNTRAPKNHRRDIAQLMTMIREKQLHGAIAQKKDDQPAVENK